MYCFVYSEEKILKQCYKLIKYVLRDTGSTCLFFAFTSSEVKNTAVAKVDL